MVRSSNSRERLLEAADALMYARGYEAVSVADLCEAADARKGSFYHWWPSKRDLALAMIDRAWQRNLEFVFEPIFDTDDPVLEKFTNYADRLADGLIESLKSTGHVAGCRYGNFAVELSTRDSVIREKVAATFQKIAAYFEQAIRDGIRAGELADDVDAEDTATAILSLMEGHMVLAKAQNDPEALRRLARDTVRLLVGNGYANEKRRPH
ncbi:MAG: TetR family transcriptional regulator [Rhodospirillaceae bacterium]|nr:TetR family transcriptional regulator [Rhodospirillaceae bacterium]